MEKTYSENLSHPCLDTETWDLFDVVLCRPYMGRIPNNLTIKNVCILWFDGAFNLTSWCYVKENSWLGIFFLFQVTAHVHFFNYVSRTILPSLIINSFVFPKISNMPDHSNSMATQKLSVAAPLMVTNWSIIQRCYFWMKNHSEFDTCMAGIKSSRLISVIFHFTWQQIAAW